MFNFTPSVYSVDTAAVNVVREARTLHKRATKGSHTAFTNALRHGEALAELDARRTNGLLVDEATGKPLTKNQLVDYVGTLERAMFFRYIQAAKMPADKIKAYVNGLGKGTEPTISGLVKHYAEKRAKADVESTYTKAKSEGQKGFTVTLYKDGTFTATKGADPKAVKKVVAALKELKG